MSTQIMDIEKAARLAASSRFSEEEITKHRTIIKRFVELYYNFPMQTWANTKWRGVKVYKAPTDLWVYQELIHEIKPDVIIETGTCFGGSALYMADVLRACGLKDSVVMTIDKTMECVDELVKKDVNVQCVEGSSTNLQIYSSVKFFIENFCTDAKVMVILDSDHKKDHVLKELELYAPLVSPGSILIVEDTIVNGNPVYKEHGEGPKEAVEEWWIDHPEFKLNTMCEKFMLTFNKGGYFEREKEEGK